MNEINIDIRFEGDKFYPTKLRDLTGFPIEVLSEYGEIADKGRYKGKPSPYGLALLKIEREKENDDLNEVFNRYLEKLLSKKEQLNEIGVEEIIIDVETPILKESEFSFNNELLQKIFQLNAIIDWHTISSEDYTLSISEFRAYLEKINDEIQKSHFNTNKLEEKLKQQQVFFNYYTNKNPTKYGIALGFFILLIQKYWDTEDEKIPSFKEAIKKII